MQKNMKRNPFRYRATLLSFIICMVLFLSAITLMGLVQSTILMHMQTNADVRLSIQNNTDDESPYQPYEEAALASYKNMRYADHATIVLQWFKCKDGSYLAKKKKVLQKYEKIADIDTNFKKQPFTP